MDWYFTDEPTENFPSSIRRDCRGFFDLRYRKPHLQTVTASESFRLIQPREILSRRVDSANPIKKYAPAVWSTPQRWLHPAMQNGGLAGCSLPVRTPPLQREGGALHGHLLSREMCEYICGLRSAAISRTADVRRL